VTSALTLTPTPRVPTRFLPDDDRDLLAYLLGRIGRKRHKNRLLAEYYDARALVKSLAMAVPPEFDQLNTVVGWPGTVVDVLNERRSIDHIHVPGSVEMSDIINQVWDDNDMDAEAPQLQLSEMIHGIAFVVVARSEDGRTIVLPTPATRMTAEYDRSQRRITAAASNDEALRLGDPRQATLYLPDRTVVVELWGDSRYRVVDEFENPSGIVPVERFVNRQRLDAPWGRSEITPTVISATNRGVRTLVAMEVAREAFAMPSQFLFNVAQEAFQDADGNQAEAWQMYWGRFKALTGEIGEDGEPSPLQPDVKQLPASSPATLIDMIKMDSQIIAAEAGIPPSNLGFVTDNPPSGDGMRAYEKRVIDRGRMRNKIDGGSYNRMNRLVLLAEGVPFDELPRVQTVWADTATYAPAAITDAVVKKVQVGMVPADSDVALEEAGYDRGQVERIQQDRRKARAAGVVADLATAAATARATRAGAVNADGGAGAAVPAG
jgi:hypothetical protein